MVKTCYVAGPMRSKPHFNFPEFYRAEGLLVAAGWRVLNPARMDAELPECHAPATNLTIEEQKELAERDATFYAERDLRAILSLRAYNGDAVVVLDGWEDSTGARAEVAVAQWISLPIMSLRQATYELRVAA